MKLNNFTIDPILLNALREDIGHGDITTESCIPVNTTACGQFVVKASGILCGADVAARAFGLLDESVIFTARYNDGDTVKTGDILATVAGPARAILTGERVALNLLQRMSGIATMTARLQALMPLADDGRPHCNVVDTRKTTPGLRVLEKYSVRIGGGGNHRFNLSDAVLIKDNHITTAGGIAQAVAAVRANMPHTAKVEVEAATLDQVQQALDCYADIIMLDNMDSFIMRKAVALIDGRAIVEASGNMGEKDLTEVAATGVDVISVGALTHSVQALDISLLLEVE
ncbi:MAG: carboxylating nicotinate-nucleotide diphosphorylase [Oscillospiraceae bacterium]|nr:carboxylating nicotinate-nucleotide diphosphorylase [Oscillospiraceae bacterium]